MFIKIKLSFIMDYKGGFLWGTKRRLYIDYITEKG